MNCTRARHIRRLVVAIDGDAALYRRTKRAVTRYNNAAPSRSRGQRLLGTLRTREA